ncbi:MAG: hypothetical protein R6W31_05900 [Bacteroidales bacterium]
MFWYFFIVIILFTLLWIMLGPVIIFINTGEGRYSVALPGIFRASVIQAEEWFMVRGSVFFIPYRFNPFGRKRKKQKDQLKKSPRKKRSLMSPVGMNLGRNMLQAFRIRKLHLNIDTDDFTLNAWLIPVFSAVNSDNIRLQANFEGEASMLLDLRTRMGALLWAIIKTKYKSMLNQ